MKKQFLLFVFLVLGYSSFAKQVTEQTAKQAGYGFLVGMNAEGLTSVNDLQLVYTSHSATANYFYVFNLKNHGFVMVTADDAVIPILGYSTNEGAFDPNNIPDGLKVMFEGYTKQMDIVFNTNAPATGEISGQWTALLEGKKKSANKTTAVTPMLTTKWNQNPNYNKLCPTDISTGNLSVTGCVATAMAQIMKFWDYPAKGIGSHSYSLSKTGLLSADFGNTTYDWINMPDVINSSNYQAVALLMFHAGVSVEMNYSSNSSGSFVSLQRSGNPPYCAETALKNTFNYSKDLHSFDRDFDATSTQDWINTLKAELDAGRPFLYAGFGTVGGHVWVADGYDVTDKFHINWGWGGASDGYYNVDDMNPPALGTGGGSGGFVDGHHAIIGIEPPSKFPSDMYEKNNVYTSAYNLPITFSGYNANLNTEGSTIHIPTDVDYYKIDLPAISTTYNWIIKARLQDKNNSTVTPNPYSVNTQFSYSTNGTIWSSNIEDVMKDSLSLSATLPISVYFKVIATVAGDTGSYRLDVTVKGMPTSVKDVNGIAEQVKVYPNPAKDVLYIDVDGLNVEHINITDLQGRIQRSIATTARSINMSVNGLASGIYFMQLTTDKGIVTKKITIE